MDDRFKTPEDWRKEREIETKRLIQDAHFWRQRYDSVIEAKREDVNAIDARLNKIYLNTRGVKAALWWVVVFGICNFGMLVAIFMHVYPTQQP